jgi:hypothetical protein
MRRLLSEPLVHFIAAGLVLFAISASTTAERAPIVVDEHVRRDLVERWQATHDAPPNDAELARVTEAWIDREVLYREGVARGFDRDDARIRALVADKMAFVLTERAAIPEPSDDQLRALFSAEPHLFERGELIDFVHVFVQGGDQAATARARELLRLLEDGASPNGLGDTFSGGRHYRRRKIEDLAETFGDEFARGLDTQPIGAWTLRPSRFGVHLVRVERRAAAERPDFASARLRVRDVWNEREKAKAVAAELTALRAGWEIVREP